MNLSRIVLCLSMSLGFAPLARAAPVLAVSFSSVASSGSFTSSQGMVDITGTTVTGSLTLSSIATVVPPPYFGAGDYLLQRGAIDLSFNILALGQTTDFSSAASGGYSSISLRDDGITQQVLFEPVFFNPHSLTTLTLTGPEGSLFSSVDDLASLHAGPGVAIVSPEFLSIYGQGSAALTITSAVFTSAATPGAPVSEPTGWPVLVSALLALSAVRTRKQSGRTQLAL